MTFLMDTAHAYKRKKKKLNFDKCINIKIFLLSTNSKY